MLDEGNIISNVEQFPEQSENISGSRDEYINYLEMSVQLLQREINHLREQEKPMDSPEATVSGTGLFNSCTSIAEVISEMHQYILDPYSVLESNIFLINSENKLIKAAETETSSTLESQIKHLDEQGIIDWALEKRSPSIIPNLSIEEIASHTFFILNPLFIRANKMGIMIARTSRKPYSFEKSDLASLSIIASSAAAAIDNIKSAKEIDAMNKRLNQLNRQMLKSTKYGTLWELAATIVDGLMASLKVIEANINLLATGIGNKKRRLEIISTEIENIKSIAGRFSKMTDSDTLDMELLPLNICNLIDEVIFLSGSQLQRAGIIIEKEFENTELQVLGIKPQLEQAVLKLLLALRDKMPEGGRIMVGVSHHGKDSVMIRISDNIPGLSFANAEKMFDPLEEGASLYLVKNIIEQQGASLSINSDIDKGTDFKLIFPIYKQK